jgi:hypothetical protein
MYTVHLLKGGPSGAPAVSAQASSLEGALGFIREYCAIEFGLIEGGWEERNGRYAMEVYDWLDLWFADPPTVAEIVAPYGFVPPAGTTA